MSLKFELQSIRVEGSRTKVRAFIVRAAAEDTPLEEFDAGRLSVGYDGLDSIVTELHEALKIVVGEEEAKLMAIGAACLQALLIDIAEIQELPPI